MKASVTAWLMPDVDTGRLKHVHRNCATVSGEAMVSSSAGLNVKQLQQSHMSLMIFSGTCFNLHGAHPPPLARSRQVAARSRQLCLAWRVNALTTPVCSKHSGMPGILPSLAAAPRHGCFTLLHASHLTACAVSPALLRPEPPGPRCHPEELCACSVWLVPLPPDSVLLRSSCLFSTLLCPWLVPVLA